MDAFTKHKVRKAMRANPDLPVKFIIAAIRASQQIKEAIGYSRRYKQT